MLFTSISQVSIQLVCFFRHARKYFTSIESDQMPDVQKVMGLLAFSSNTQLKPYKVRSAVFGSVSVLQALNPGLELSCASIAIGENEDSLAPPKQH